MQSLGIQPERFPVAQRPRSQHDPRYRVLLKRLIQARKDANLTQSDAARLLNRGQAYVSRSEIGDRRVDAIELMDFAKIYGKPVSYFLSGK